MRTRLDPHVKILDDRVIARAKARGIDALVYAPHFRRLPAIETAAAAASDDTLTVLPGREIFTGTWRSRRHILALGLAEPVPDFIPLETALQECARQGASVLVPHPTFMTVSLTAAEIRNHRHHVDALEGYNPKFLPQHTRRARALGERLGLPMFGSTYAHLRGTVGEVWTDVEADIASVRDLQEAIAAGDLDGIHHRAGSAHLARRLVEFAHLFWENSWQKFDRVILRGMEATHPRHPAYEGRFEDVARY